jgi:N-methylhydantoinase A/oxoprolinase/acetone carboxylase beta subunit
MLAERGMLAKGECPPASVEGECLPTSVETGMSADPGMRAKRVSPESVEGECLPASAEEAFSAEHLTEERDALLARACADLGEAAQRVAVRYELRYRGQSFELAVDEQGGPPDPNALREAFAAAHEQRYGYRDDGVEVELVTIRASAWGAAPRLRLAGAAEEPAPGTVVEGPTICALPGSTLYVPSGWKGEVDAQGTVHLHDVDGAA